MFEQYHSDDLIREHRREMQRQAEKHQLVALARRGRSKRIAFYASLLAWLGARLVSLGTRLQRRYDEAAYQCRLETKTAAPPVPSNR
jgi:hypothetical protein